MNEKKSRSQETERFVETQNQISQMISMMVIGQVRLPPNIYAIIQDKKGNRYASEHEFSYTPVGNALISEYHGIGQLRKGVPIGQILDRILDKEPYTSILCDQKIAYSLGMEQIPKDQIRRFEFDTFGIVEFNMIRPKCSIHV